MTFVHATMTASLYLSCMPAITAFGSTGQQTFLSCTDYHCDVEQRVSLTPAQWEPVRDLFPADTSPAEERESIRQAIAFLEKTVGAITGTWRDLGAISPVRDRPDKLTASRNQKTPRPTCSCCLMTDCSGGTKSRSAGSAKGLFLSHTGPQ